MAAIAVIVVLTTACSGGEPAATPSVLGTTVQRDDAAQGAVKAAAGEQLRRAMMQAGTDWVAGELAEFCTGTGCTVDPTARPGRSLAVPDDGLVLFVVGKRPDAASLQVTKVSGKQVLDRALSPSTSMGTVLDLRPGRYVVAVSVTWEQRRARWVFGVRVPDRT